MGRRTRLNSTGYEITSGTRGFSLGFRWQSNGIVQSGSFWGGALPPDLLRMHYKGLACTAKSPYDFIRVCHPCTGKRRLQ